MKALALIAAVAIIAFLMGWVKLPDSIPWPIPSPSGPVVPAHVPSAEMQAQVAEVKAILASAPAEDKAHLAALYSAFADMLDDDVTVTSTAQVRLGLERSQAILFIKRGFMVKYPTLAPAVGKVLSARLGDVPKELSPTLRAEAVLAFKALAWAAS